MNASVSAVGPHDKFFYTSDLLLHYFNYTNNTVYQWPNIGSSACGLRRQPDGRHVSDLRGLPRSSLRRLVLCRRYDSGSLSWGVFWVNYDPSGVVGPVSAAWTPTNDITADLELISTTATVTGVAADPYGFAYVTFYNTQAAGSPVSGMVEFDTYAGGPPSHTERNARQGSPLT